MANAVESFVYCIFFCICLTGLIWRLFLENRGIFILEYETWCNIIECGYYFLQMIIGFVSVCNRTSENSCQNFLKYTLFKLIFPPIMAAPVIFFLGYNLSWFYFYIDLKKVDFWCDFINHIIAPGCCLLDVIIFGRQYSPSNLLDLIIITGIYVAYSILCLPFQTNHVYEFITNGKGFIISAAIVFYCIGIVMHFFYITITKIRNCGTVKS